MSEPSNDMTPEQSQAARALLKWSQVRLAAKSNVSEGTIRDFESGRRRLRPARVAAIRRALELAGVLFTEPNLSLHDSRIPRVALSNEKPAPFGKARARCGTPVCGFEGIPQTLFQQRLQVQVPVC